ncbi:MAG: hypothetical protein BGO01_02945 [Armatimonadetes bacterium 55-13]|nr:MFS transporter [Armatimonadota bacterium]OJU63616.1 MAG: hypothetical protein BGO01_02945 [Armatimonadetes bacterium 55-13]
MDSIESVYPRELGERKIGFWEHLALSAFWFGTNFIWGAFLGPVLSSQMAKLAPNSSAASLGILYAFGALPALLVPLIFGPLSDRCRHALGRRRPYIIGGGLMALAGLASMAVAFQSQQLTLYFLGYFILQIGANIAIAAYSGIIPDLVPKDQRGKASGYMALMSQLATLFGALISGILIDKGAHMLVFGLISGIFFLFLLITIYGVREQRFEDEVPPFEFATYLKSLWIDPKKFPDFAWVWLTRALMMLGFYAIQPYLLYFLRDVIKVENPATKSAIVFALILLAATISGFVGGMISDKTGRKPIVKIASMTIAVMCVILVFCRNLEQALIGGAIFGLGYGAYISVDWALGTDVLPNKEDAGKDMAVWHVSMTLPQQIAPLIAGQALAQFAGQPIIEHGEKVQSYTHSGYIVIFFFAAICFAASGLLIDKVKGAK